VAIFPTAFGVLEGAMKQCFAPTFNKVTHPTFVGFCSGLLGRIYPRMTAAVIDRCFARPPNGSNRRSTMSKSRTLGAAIAFAVLSAAALSATPADAAVVYCKTAGVPQGCVVRAAPVVAPVVRPVAPAAAAVRVGYVGAPGASARHVGYTRVTPYGVRHVGYTRVRR
jgi:hypothetical protein